MDALDRKAVKLLMLIRSREDWSSEYAKDPKTHAKLLRSEARLQVQLTKYFRDVANDAVKYIHWQPYLNQRSQAQTLDKQPLNYNIEVIVQDVPEDKYDGTFIKIVFEELALMTALGAMAGENIYGIPLGIQSTDAIIQELTTEHVASLVGKKVLKDGSIVDNPKASYRISDKMRKDIAQSIKTSLNLGEDIQAATDRLKKTISNPNRAKLIAQTESVNAYQAGLTEFGKQSGAVGKEWQDVGAVDMCRVYAELGPVPFDYDYDGNGLQGPALHPRCRCSRRLIYRTEWDSIQAAKQSS
jgi:hypothetical protein